MNYHFSGEETIESPSLVYYEDVIARNIDKAVALAGGAERLWPHVKTHKTAAVLRMQMAKGITRFKCATIAEAEMCAREGAREILLSYPLVGPAIGRFLQLRARYAASRFWAIGDDSGQLELLGKGAEESGAAPVDTLADVNMGMNRTGVSFDKLEAFCAAAAKTAGIALKGFHGYDGHLGIKDLAERKAAVSVEWKKLLAVKAALEKQGVDVSVLVMGGTPTFAYYREEAGIYLSPGTFFVQDYGYTAKYPDLQFTAGAAVLTRVVSHPAPGLFTLDTGYKAIAAEQSERGVIADLPGAKPLGQSEEHWVWQAEDGQLPAVGSVLYVIPYHVCPTSALYPGVWVVNGGKLVNYWEVTARNRFLPRGE